MVVVTVSVVAVVVVTAVVVAVVAVVVTVVVTAVVVAEVSPDLTFREYCTDDITSCFVRYFRDGLNIRIDNCGQFTI